MQLRIEQLRLHRGQLPVLVDYQRVFSHRRTCLLAPNGAGKSSLLCAIAGLLPLHHGRIVWQGREVKAAQADIAIASDSILLPDFLTARDCLQLQLSMWQLDWPGQLITDFHFQTQLAKPVASLSAGNLKKLQLILALMRKSSLLLLDEPTVALDQPALAALWQYVSGYDGTMLAASHDADALVAHGFVLEALHEE